jgi:hypothetical protein
LEKAIILSTYSAMLGMISPNIRLITIDWGHHHYTLKAFFDREVTEDDLDILKSITTEVAADFPEMGEIKEFAEFSLSPLSDLPKLKKAVFIRFGELEL